VGRGGGILPQPTTVNAVQTKCLGAKCRDTLIQRSITNHKPDLEKI